MRAPQDHGDHAVGFDPRVHDRDARHDLLTGVRVAEVLEDERDGEGGQYRRCRRRPPLNDMCVGRRDERRKVAVCSYGLKLWRHDRVRLPIVEERTANRVRGRHSHVTTRGLDAAFFDHA